jgi:hypothetical protein
VSTTSRRVAAAAALTLGLAACGAPSPAAAPGSALAAHLVMTDARVGYAVWPSGVRWIVLGTTDGWRTAVNRTPVAVPTDGGLVLSARGPRVAVGVLPHEQLVVSPVLQSTGSARVWTPSQLPSALAATAAALARADGATYAVLADGSVVSAADGATSWTPATSAGLLAPGGGLSLSGVAFPDGRTGFVMGTGPSDRPVLFTGGGSSWAAVGLPVTGGGTATALPPCRAGATWVAPVVRDGRLEVFTAADLAGPWTAGPGLDTTATPLVGCGPHVVWAAVPDGGSDVLRTAAPGGAWTAHGDVGSHLASLAPVSDTGAFAADADATHVLAISVAGEGRATTTALPLPDWAATVGGPAMRN